MERDRQTKQEKEGEIKSGGYIYIYKSKKKGEREGGRKIEREKKGE